MTNFVVLTLGNSTAAAALVTDGRLGEVSRTDVRDLRKLSDLLTACRADAAPPVPLVVASVNPPALEALRRLAEELHLAPPHVARDDFFIQLGTVVDEPDRVGIDRLLGALAAYRQTGGPCLVLDCGTATTLSAVSADGIFLGGAIFPSPDLMARALAEGTAQLPHVEVRESAPVIGRNTEAAIRAGVSLGWTGAVIHLLMHALGELEKDAPSDTPPETVVFLTGGGASFVAPQVSELLGGMAEMMGHDDPAKLCREAPNLVLEGLAIAYRESPGK